MVWSSRILFDVSEVPVLTLSLNGWAFGSGRFLLGGFVLKVQLDLFVLLDDHNGTFFTHIILEATGMTRITLNIFDVTPLRAVALAIASVTAYGVL